MTAEVKRLLADVIAHHTATIRELGRDRNPQVVAIRNKLAIEIDLASAVLAGLRGDLVQLKIHAGS